MNFTKQILVILVCLPLYVAPVVAQESQSAKTSQGSPEVKGASGAETSVVGAQLGRSAALTVLPTINLIGFGTSGRIPKFTGGIFLANSVISEDSLGRIGIGTTTPGSTLTVAGQIETKSGGIKFPDGTVQLTAAAAALFQVDHDATLTGNGTGAMPLGVAIPLSLSGSFPASILEIANNTSDGLVARGGDGGSAAVRAFGGDGGNPFISGAAVIATGGKRPEGTGGGSGGEGVIANGGASENGNGGPGLVANGGAGSLGSRGGHGIVAFAGASPSGDGLAGLFFGNIENRSPGKGIILRSPDNLTCRLLTIDNAGALVLTAVTCP